MQDRDTTIAHLREILREFVAERQWQKYHTPRNLAAAISVESAELLELYQWLSEDEGAKRWKDEPEFRRAVSEEMVDVLMYLMSMANTLDIDFATAVEAKMAKNRKKYPPEKFRGHYHRPLPE